MVGQIEHIGIVVDELNQAKAFLGGVLGFEAGREMDLPDRGVRVAFYRSGGVEIELIEVTDGAMRERRLRGDKARIEHIAVIVADLEKAMAKLRESGVAFTTPEIQHVRQSGSYFVMTDPHTSDGVQYQLIRRTPVPPSSDA